MAYMFSRLTYLSYNYGQFSDEEEIDIMIILRYALILTLLTHILFAARVTALEWKKGETFSGYLARKGITQKVLDGVSKKDVKFLLDIQGQQTFYELKDRHGVVEQVLIPISKEMQIHLAREHGSGIYNFEIITTTYTEETYSATVEIEKNLDTDINKMLHHKALGNKLGQLFKGSGVAKKFHKGDKVSFLYNQRKRMGKPYGSPEIKVAMVEAKEKRVFLYADEDGYGYTSSTQKQAYTVTGKKKVVYMRPVSNTKSGQSFGMPLRHIRITSSFAYKRYHPILKRYRPHHGTDFGAKRGTPLLAVSKGIVSFSGRMGGYGNVVKIKHKGGYESLYAHQSKRRVRKGQRVTKGQVIGYVGSTGRSTGPHLHFGLKKHGRWINPMRVLRKKKSKTVLKQFTKYETTTTTKYKTVEIKDAQKNKKQLLRYLAKEEAPYVWSKKYFLRMKVKSHDKHKTL